MYMSVYVHTHICLCILCYENDTYLQPEYYSYFQIDSIFAPIFLNTNKCKKVQCEQRRVVLKTLNLTSAICMFCNPDLHQRYSSHHRCKLKLRPSTVLQDIPCQKSILTVVCSLEVIILFLLHVTYCYRALATVLSFYVGCVFLNFKQ